MMRWPWTKRFAATPESAKPDTSEAGRVVYNTSSFGRAIGQFSNPDEVIKQSGFKYLRNMDDKDGFVYGLTRTRIQEVKRRGWHVKPFSDEQIDIDVADFVTWAIDEMPGSFDEDIGEALDALKFGYSLQEKMWGYTDNAMYRGKVVPLALNAKQQERYQVTLDEFGNVTSILQQSRGVTWEPVPEGKFIWYTFEPSPGNPYGHGLYSRVFWHDWFLREGWKFWAIYLERFGSPHLKILAPALQSSSDQTAAKEILDNWMNVTGVIVPEGLDLQFLEAARGGSATYKEFAQEQRDAIATVILGQTLSSSQGDVGALALGTVHKEVQDEITDSDVKWLYARLNDCWVREMVAYNWPNLAGSPILGPEPRDDRDLSVWADIVGALRAAGQPIPQSWVRDTFGIPDVEIGDDGEPEAVLAAPAPRVMVPGLPNADDGDTEDDESADKAHDHGHRVSFAERIEFWRAPTKFEVAESLNKLRDGLSELEGTIVVGVKPQFVAMRDDLLRQVKKAGVFEADDYDKRLAIVRGLTLKPRTREFDATIRRMLLIGALTGRESAIDELEAKGVLTTSLFAADDVLPAPDDILTDWNTRRTVTPSEWRAMDRAARGSAWYVATTQGETATGLVRNALNEAIGNDWTTAQFRTRVVESFENVWVGDVFGTATGTQTTARMNTIFRNATMEAINHNRQRVFEEAEDPEQATDPVVAYQISVIMDDRTSTICEPLDQKIVRAGTDFMPRPPYHHQCRTIWVPILESEAAQMGREDLITDKPVVSRRVDGETVQAPWQPQDGFGSTPGTQRN